MKKQKYKLGWKLQDIQLAWLLSVKSIISGDGLVNSIKCIVVQKFEGGEIFFIPQTWNI